jgi:hypothetical protein
MYIYLRVSVVAIGSDGTIKGIVMSNFHDDVCNDGRLRDNSDYTLLRVPWLSTENAAVVVDDGSCDDGITNTNGEGYCTPRQ